MVTTILGKQYLGEFIEPHPRKIAEDVRTFRTLDGWRGVIDYNDILYLHIPPYLYSCWGSYKHEAPAFDALSCYEYKGTSWWGFSQVISWPGRINRPVYQWGKIAPQRRYDDFLYHLELDNTPYQLLDLSDRKIINSENVDLPPRLEAAFHSHPLEPIRFYVTLPDF